MRERREDIVSLSRTFAIRASQRLGLSPPTLNARTFQHLERHEWPGNVRELKRFAENFVLGLIDADPAQAADAAPGDFKPWVDRFEAQLIEEALTVANGDITRACAAFNLPCRTFYYKVQRLGVDVTRFRD